MARAFLLATVLVSMTLLATAQAGTWGTGSFDNDDAADFVSEVAGQGDTLPLRAALARATSAEGYLEAPDAAAAIAAAEMVAAARGTPTLAAKENGDVIAWVVRTKPAIDPALVAEAMRAIDRVLGDASELHEIWAESDEYDEWREGVVALRARLAMAAAPTH